MNEDLHSAVQNRLFAAIVLSVCAFGPRLDAHAAVASAPQRSYQLIADGAPVAEFAGESGLPATGSAEDAAGIDLNSIRVALHETPGRNSPQIISLRGGAPVRAGYLEGWLAAITHGQTRRKTLTIVSHDAQGMALRQWILTSAQPLTVQVAQSPERYREVRIICQSIIRTK